MSVPPVQSACAASAHEQCPGANCTCDCHKVFGGEGPCPWCAEWVSDLASAGAHVERHIGPGWFRWETSLPRPTSNGPAGGSPTRADSLS